MVLWRETRKEGVRTLAPNTPPLSGRLTRRAKVQRVGSPKERDPFRVGGTQLVDSGLISSPQNSRRGQLQAVGSKSVCVPGTYPWGYRLLGEPSVPSEQDKGMVVCLGSHKKGDPREMTHPLLGVVCYLAVACISVNTPYASVGRSGL